MKTQDARLQVFKLVPALIVGFGTFLVLGSPVARADMNNEVNDMSITEAVEDEFIFDRGVPFNEIDIHVAEGVVTLEGTTDNILAKQRAAKLARTVKGVRAVVNEVKVEPRETKTAGALRSDVNTALMGDPATESFQIDVSAMDSGMVTLRGNVDSWQERQLAEKVAMGVSGVTEVTNEIDVEYDVERGDNEIKAEIERTLTWDTLVDSALVDVKVKEGNVTLSGTVGSAAEKREARLDAWIAGVKSVKDDQLEVRNWARDDQVRKEKFVEKPDDEIKKAVKDALLFDPRVMSFNITPSVENGVVTLRGNVNNLKAKRAAANDARNTVGVIDVRNRIKVRPEVEMTDQALAKQVRNSLARDPYVESFEVDVDVVGGVAYLKGSVDSYFEKAQADDVASMVTGVVDVRNKLNVFYNHSPIVYDPFVDDWFPPMYDWYGDPPHIAVRPDQEITREIRDQLWWSPFVDADDVRVRVEDGVATLTGMVESADERRAAQENAYEGGARWVNNNLTVQ